MKAPDHSALKNLTKALIIESVNFSDIIFKKNINNFKNYFA